MLADNEVMRGRHFRIWHIDHGPGIHCIGLGLLFAEPASKELRNAVKISHYRPKDQFVQLEFKNEPWAELVQRTT